MALLLPLLNEHQHLMSSLLGGDQHLSLKLSDEDFLSPLLPKRVRRQISSSPYGRGIYQRERHLSVPTDKKDFHVSIDVQQFTPEEITVKSINDNTIVVECKHEEKPDEHGYISRHFVRKYKVPQGHDITKSTSKLSSDGVLTIAIPKVEKHEKGEIDIPITFTNQPSQIEKAAENTAKSDGQICKKKSKK